MSRVRLLHGVIAALLLTMPVASAFAQSDPPSSHSPVSQGDSRSATLAAELAHLLDAAKLTNIAAKTGDRYVGAMYIPGSQLLVVSGKFPGADRMAYLISQKSYNDAYLDLSSASDRGSRLLISDLGADGLHYGREKDQPFDMIAVAGQGVAFDREWRKNRDIPQDEYGKTYSSMDQQYSELLQVLIDALKKPS